MSPKSINLKKYDVKPKRRLKKKDTPPEVWIAHRKLRKKIASAKWYAKKRKAELAEQDQFRAECELRLQQRKAERIWSPHMFNEWRCVTSYMFHGFPMKPKYIATSQWCEMMDIVQQRMSMMEEHGIQTSDHVSYTVLWNNTKKQLCQKMALRELWEWYVHLHASCQITWHSYMAAVQNGEVYKIISLSSSEPLSSPSSSLFSSVSSSYNNSSSTSSSTPSSSFEPSWAPLVEYWVPMVCTGVGALFLQLENLHLRQRHWQGILQYMRTMHAAVTHDTHSNVVATSNCTSANNIATSRMAPHVYHTIPADVTPMRHPMANPCIVQSPMLSHLVQELFLAERDMMQLQSNKMENQESVQGEDEDDETWLNEHLRLFGNQHSSLDSSSYDSNEY